MTVVFGPNLKVLRVLSLVSRVACPSIDLVCFLNVFGLGAGAFFSNANGKPMTVWVRSLVTLFISVFLSVVRVCLLRSPLLAVLYMVFLALSFLLECVCSHSLLTLGRLRWLHCGFLGL